MALLPVQDAALPLSRARAIAAAKPHKRNQCGQALLLKRSAKIGD